MSDLGQTGRVVGGRFELLEPLGSGGMGTVWRARDVGLHREVAIKEVRPPDAVLYEHNPSLAAQQRERVLRESRALARLQHPNVVSIYQIIESEDSPYPWIVMELVRGTSLDARLQTGPLAPAEAARIGRDVLAALRAAHMAGILHRDVKPGNVLLRPDGGAVLTDFGIAALHDSVQLTATGELIGSPEYIAPERLHGDETQTSSDFWSLAMLLYVAVEGFNPMRRSTTMATLAAVMTEAVPPPRRSGALGPALSAVLVPDPSARPTGDQLDRMLAAAEHGAAGPHTPAGFPAQPHTPAGFPAQPHGAWYPRHGAHPPAGSGPVPLGNAGSAPAHPGAGSGPVPAPARRRTAVAVFSGAVAVLLVAVSVLIVQTLSTKDDPTRTGSGAPGTGTEQATVGTPPPGTTTTATTTPAPPPDPLTPDGARAVVAALAEVMGGSSVSELTLYPEYAMATAPTAAVPNGFDDFEYRAGVASRSGADGVDADRVLIDLNTVNWDALPGLWERATNELKVPNPTLRYVIVDSDIIDGTPSMRLYLTNDYGAGYLSATLAGEVVEVFPLDG